MRKLVVLGVFLLNLPLAIASDYTAEIGCFSALEGQTRFKNASLITDEVIFLPAQNKGFYIFTKDQAYFYDLNPAPSSNGYTYYQYQIDLPGYESIYFMYSYNAESLNDQAISKYEKSTSKYPLYRPENKVANEHDANLTIHQNLIKKIPQVMALVVERMQAGKYRDTSPQKLQAHLLKKLEVCTTVENQTVQALTDEAIGKIDRSVVFDW